MRFKRPLLALALFVATICGFAFTPEADARPPWCVDVCDGSNPDEFCSCTSTLTTTCSECLL